MNTQSLLCPECEKGHLVASLYVDDFQHDGQVVSVDGLEGYVCDRCGADPVFPDQIRRNHRRIADAKRRSDGRMTGDEVRAIREQFGLSQQDAARLFGGGTNAFSKYERGDVLQSVAMDRLLKAVAFHPFLLDFLCEEAKVTVQPDSCLVVERYQAGTTLNMRDASFRSRTVAGNIVIVESERWQKYAA
jgi:HTH-type transcriptional regulator/antitoxin MqsA